MRLIMLIVIPVSICMAYPGEDILSTQYDYDYIAVMGVRYDWLRISEEDVLPFIGVSADFDISKNLFIHGSASLGFTIVPAEFLPDIIFISDFSVGLGYTIRDNYLSIFARAHDITISPSGEVGVSALGFEPGVRIGFSKTLRLYIELGVIYGSAMNDSGSAMIPKLGLVWHFIRY